MLVLAYGAADLADEARAPVLSADGSRVAFGVPVRAEEGELRSRLHVADTASDAAVAVGNPSAFGRASLSGDGRTVAFRSGTDAEVVPVPGLRQPG